MPEPFLAARTVRWTIRTRITLSFLGIILLATVAAGVAITNMYGLQTDLAADQQAAHQAAIMNQLGGNVLRLVALAYEQVDAPTPTRSSAIAELKARIRHDLQMAADAPGIGATTMEGPAAAYARFEDGLDLIFARSVDYAAVTRQDLPRSLDAVAERLSKLIVASEDPGRTAVANFQLMRTLRNIELFLARQTDGDAARSAVNGQLGLLDGQLAALTRLLSPEQRATFGDTLAALEAYKSAISAALTLHGQVVALHEKVFRRDAEELERLTDFLVAQAAQRSEDVAAASIAKTRRVMLATVAAALVLTLFGIAAALLVARALTAGLEQMTDTMKRMARDDAVASIPGLARTDEIGDMAAALQIFQQGLLERGRFAAATQSEAETRREHQTKLDALIEDFRRSVAGALTAVAASNTQMQASARLVSDIAGDTAERSLETSAKSEEATRNVGTAMGAAAHLVDAIGEIARTVTANAGIVSRALVAAEATQAQVDKLSKSADRIGSVVSVIRSVAEQTNLLALNATIEAARAGDAGRGFAVVASEVKTLANQTARATADVGDQIGAMQAATAEAVGIISHIAEIMREVDSHTALIAAAVQEQEASTEEITRNVQLASASSEQITGTLADVRSFVQATSKSADEMMQAATASARETHSLHQTVETFLSRVGRA